eukprot:COSAG01_NODE_264_length_19971_cov_62.193923_5_plen_116_part_00
MHAGTQRGRGARRTGRVRHGRRLQEGQAAECTELEPREVDSICHQLRQLSPSFTVGVRLAERQVGIVVPCPDHAAPKIYPHHRIIRYYWGGLKNRKPRRNAWRDTHTESTQCPNR